MPHVEPLYAVRRVRNVEAMTGCAVAGTVLLAEPWPRCTPDDPEAMETVRRIVGDIAQQLATGEMNCEPGGIAFSWPVDEEPDSADPDVVTAWVGRALHFAFLCWRKGDDLTIEVWGLPPLSRPKVQ